jgi:protein-tyrosine phosphatase
MSLAASRHWALPDTHNIRDLGGYARADGGMTQWRRILRGEALHHLSPQSVSELVANGLALVLDLRGPHETGLARHPFSTHEQVAYRNIALFDALPRITLTETPFDMAQRYCNALDKCGPQLADALRVIATAPHGIVLFHCTAGKDRTGIIAALVLLACGVAPAVVVADYALTASAHELIDQLRERALAAGGHPEHIERVLASDADTMQVMIDHLERTHGGIDAYLPAIGLTLAETMALVDRLCR